ncbi:MAG: molybdopterin cofactor-binding domain-containing protein [Vicinamibacteria bacterium]
MSAVVLVSRRSFLELTGLAAGALVFGVRPGSAADAPVDRRLGLFVSLDASGTVRIVAHRSEMGQGIRTALPMVVADEMEADLDRVEVVQALGDERYGDQNTDGSHSVRDFLEPMRVAGASARHMLVAAAAATWGVPAADCEAREHRVRHRASGRSLGYGELAEAAAKVVVPEPKALRLKSRAEWRYIGKGRALVDAADIATGRAVYGIDAKAEGLLHASIERCPAVGGRPASFDAAAALKVAGVRHVIELPPVEKPPLFKPLGGVAVLADHTWAAWKGREALNVKWELGPNGSFDSEAYRKALFESVAKPARVVRQRGDVDAALAAAAKRVSATYYAPLLAHASIEPPAALAVVTGDRCEVWASTQSPMTCVSEVAGALSIPKENVTVHVTLLGGGFGRKSKPDYVVEAALLAKKTGRPVKVTWTREDEMRHGYYHSVSAQRLEGGLDASGRAVAWLHRTAFPPIGSTFDAAARYADAGELGLGFTDLPYDLPNLRLENAPADPPVRIGWMRSVANIYHAFAACSFADELAHAAGADPRDFLLSLLGAPRRVDLAADGAKYDNYGGSPADFPLDTGRLRRVVELATREAGWGRRLPKGRGLGLAAHRSFLTYVAVVAEVSVDAAGDARVEEAHVAFDCGTFVNRDTVITQAQGAFVFAMSGALHGKITAKNGAIEQSNFHDYPLARIDEVPRAIHVHLVDSDAAPAGVGEPGVPPVAPAIANAIFAACGERRRELPLGRRQARA